MPTRKQDPESAQFRQDAFASSAAYDRGILGNLLSDRCRKVADRDEIAMLWWLQQISLRDGGLDKFAAEFVEANKGKVGTPTMRKLGMRPDQIYNAEQVRLVRTELPGMRNFFPLRGECYQVGGLGLLIDEDYRRRVLAEEGAIAKNYPDGYRAADFVSACLRPQAFVDFLRRALIDPASPSLRAGLPVFPQLWEALKDWQQQECAASRDQIVETEVTKKVFEELDFALDSRAFVLIEGRERIGKSEAAKAWCAQRPGRAIYARLESGTDEATLFRSIARAVGTACSYGRKATEMRARIQDALQPAQVMLVLDEAHFLWPQSDRSDRSAPKRVDWLRTALVDFGVPIALISSPQYFERSCERFRKAGWNSLQIQGRLARITTLPEPEQINSSDVIKVVCRVFPAADQATAKRIAGIAIGTVGFLTTIRHLRMRVDFLTSRHPNQSEATHLTAAIAEYLPAPPAAGVKSGAEAATSKSPVSRMQPPCSSAAPAMPPRSVAPANLSSVHRNQAALSVT